MKYFLIGLIFFCQSVVAYSPGDFYFDPHLAIGINPAQGTHYMLGADLGYGWDENLAFGVGGYFSFGEQPEHDREIGGGPFVSYVYPVASFLVASLRQEINYLDLFDPIKSETPTGTTYSHNRETGLASISRAGIHLSFTENFGLALGYRLVIGLTNNNLDNGRSGAYLGFSIGI